jgi:hypothetical protein
MRVQAFSCVVFSHPTALRPDVVFIITKQQQITITLLFELLCCDLVFSVTLTALTQQHPWTSQQFLQILIPSYLAPCF